MFFVQPFYTSFRTRGAEYDLSNNYCARVLYCPSEKERFKSPANTMVTAGNPLANAGPALGHERG